MLPVVSLLLATTLVPSLPAPSLLSEMPRTMDVRALKHNTIADAAVTAGLAALWLSSETLFKHSLASEACRWCDRNPDGSDALNDLDSWGRRFRWRVDVQLTADGISNITAFLLLPVTLALTDAYLVNVNGTYTHVAGEDLLLVAEAAAFAVTVTQGAKFLTARERPFVHEMYEVEPYTKDPLDNNLSFFSGHTAFVFALTVGAGTIAELRGYKQRWLVWALGIPAALITPYLRIGADRHYITDVLAGALVGSAFGFGIPVLFHGRSGGLVDKRIGPDEISLVAAPGTVGLVGRF